MRRYTLMPVGACLFVCCSLPVPAQMPHTEKYSHARQVKEEDDPSVILEIGAATSWTTTGGTALFAPNIAAEATPIENVLELEAGTSPFFTRRSTEWDTDLLFKKPWTLSNKAEFMMGVGPEWVHLLQSGRTSDSVAGEVAGDFMFWPNGKHRFGWFLEPTYDYSFAGGHQQSLGISAGLLIGIRRRHP